MGVIVDVLEHIFYFISSLIYQLIIDVYNVFERLCNSRILDSSTIQAIADRMALLLGLVMLFIVMVSVVQMVLNPDLVSDKEKGAGNIVKKVILVIVMLGISNFAFRTLYEVQNIVIKSNIVAKLLLPNEVNTDDFGGVLSSELFMSFYHVNPRFLNNEGELISDEKDVKQCYDDLNTLKDNIVKGEGFNTGKDCIDLEVKENGEKHSVVNFNIILSVGVGAVALWFLFNYCITIGIRTVQLAFLEIIAPMAIISYLAPKKETMFEKWWKLYFATYIDVFIRMAIIYFIVFLIATIFENGGSWAFWNSVGKQDFWSDTFITVIMIMALLMFGKKAPDLLKKLFPASASGLGFGARSMKNLFGDMLGGNLIKSGLTRATGFGIGGAIGGVGNLARSLFEKDKDGNPLNLKDKLANAASGMWHGAKAGAGANGIFKSFGASNKAAMEQVKKLAEWRANGGESPWTRWRTGMEQRFGLLVDADRLDLIKADLEEENSVYKSYDSYVDAMEKRAESQILKGVFNDNENAKIALQQKNLAEIYIQQSANIKRSDFNITDERFYEKAAEKFKIDKNDFSDDTVFKQKVDAALKDAKTAGNDYTIEMANEEEYQSALQNLATKAADANSEYLKRMKEAKQDYITEVAAGKRTDIVVKQNMDQAAGIIDANRDKIEFLCEDVDENGNATGVIISSKDVAGADMMKNYTMIDGINAMAKAKISENNIALAENKTKGKAARADAKYNPKSSR